MRHGILAAQAQAARLLRRYPALWLPAWGLDAVLLLLAGALLKVWWATTLADPAGPLLPARYVVAAVVILLGWVALDAGWLHVCERALRGGPVRWRDWLAVRREAAGALLAGRLLLLGGYWLIWLAGLAMFLALISGADRLTLQRVMSGGGVSEVYGAWLRRGGFWLIGTMLLLAASGALREMARTALIYWRAALLGEGGLAEAVRQAIRFGAGRGWLLIGRHLFRLLIGAAAVLGPIIVADFCAAVLLELPDEFAAGRELGFALVRVMTWLAVVMLLAAARVWLNLGDLVLYRLNGGPEQRPELAGAGVRRPRRRQGPVVPPWRLVVASEPAREQDVWEPGPASEPG